MKLQNDQNRFSMANIEHGNKNWEGTEGGDLKLQRRKKIIKICLKYSKMMFLDLNQVYY
jgi:hypothetical protein